MARRGLDPPGTTEGEVSRLAMAGVGRGEWTRGPQPRATGAAFHGASFSSQSEEGTPALRGQTAGDQTSASHSSALKFICCPQHYSTERERSNVFYINHNPRG